MLVGTPRVVVFSALNVDEVLQVPKIDPNSEQRPYAHDIYGGGSGANTAVGIARGEHLVGVIGAVGSDTAGATFIEELQQQGGLGMDTRWVVRKPGPTGRAIVISSPDPAARMILLSPGANSHYSQEDLDAAIAQGAANADLVHLTSFVDDEQLRLQGDFLEHVPDTTVVSLSPGALYAERGMGGIERLLRRTNLLICNWDELNTLVNSPGGPIGGATRSLFDRFSVLEAVAITLGSGKKIDDEGLVMEPDPDFDYERLMLTGRTLPILGSAILLRSGVRIDTPLVRLEQPVVDTTGAGDAWASGLLSARFLSGMEWSVAARIAGIIAAHTLGYTGGRAGLPNSSQINEAFLLLANQ